MHFKVPAKDTCSQLKMVAQTNHSERRGEFDLEKKLHLAKALHNGQTLKNKENDDFSLMLPLI